MGGNIIWDLGKIFGIWDLRLIVTHENILLMIQVCMKHIVSHILYGLLLFLVTFALYVTMKGQFVSSSGR